MIFVLLVFTLIGYLCGSALIGLGVGVAIFVLGAWADDSTDRAIRRHHRRRRQGRR